MTELFDALTVACFLALAAAFFVWTERDTRTLLNVSFCGVAFAVANYLGNGEWPILGLLLIVAGVGYGWLVITAAHEKRDR
jgi:uncharacterized membrane protein